MGIWANTIVGMAAVCAPTAHAADDAALYAPAPPPGSAFVRLLQAGGPSGGSVGTQAVAGLEPGAASAYVVAAQGKVSTKLGGDTHALAVSAGGYYSVAWLGGAPTVFEDAPPTSRTKAVITVYNLSDTASVRLTTADGSVEIVGGVAPGTSGHRELNALAVPLRVASPAGPVAELGQQVLERGAAYSVVVTGSGGKASARWVRSQTAAP